MAFLSNYLLSSAFGLDWRWMLGIEALPAALYLAAIARVPESPRWLLLKGGNETEAFAIVRSVNPRRADEVIAEIRGSLTGASDRLFVRRYRLPILLAILIAFFNQLSGINFVIYFAPRIFGLAGLDSSAALLSTTGVGMVNLLFTLLGVYLIDRAGRRMLMTLGSIGYLVSLSAVAWSFYTGASGMVVVLFVFLFIASHAVGQGAVIWVFIAEIFPNTVRSKGQSLGSGTHWVLAATIALLMPYALSAFEAHTIFGFFAAMMLLQLAFVLLIMPETRGRTLESVAEDLTNH